MNDTTLPKKRQQSSRSKAAPLRPGFGLHDWLTLLRRAKDLSQRRGAPIRKSIPLSEIAQHNKPYDGWMILRGKVYNIAPYLPYHPGGQQIMEQCLGGDGTKLFDKYHSWVNIEGLIGPLLLGYVQIEKRQHDNDEENGGGYLKGKVDDDGGSAMNGNDNDIVLPSSDNNNATAATASFSGATKTSSQDNVEFSMPKPRPTKGSVVPSLLGATDNDDDNEVEVEELL